MTGDVKWKSTADPKICEGKQGRYNANSAAPTLVGDIIFAGNLDGHARAYDPWAQMGASGWSYSDVLPYFKRMETWHGPDASDWRGTNGPLHITRGPRNNPLYNAFINAGAQAGYETTDDYNGEKQEGFGPMEQTVWKGRRWSTANAYLKPALRRFKCRLKLMITLVICIAISFNNALHGAKVFIFSGLIA